MTPCAADGDTLGARFAAALERLGFPLNAPFALAVSGGGDSVALMHLAADWRNARKLPLEAGSVLTVDHGLRPGSVKEAAATASWAKSIGFAAHTLRWRGRRPRSNIEDGARSARYRLIGDWCLANGVSTVLVAHTREDQAETFLLRLGRGSGVDGLSAMRGRAPFPLPGYDGVALVRPLLDIGRDELRADLAARGAAFIEDPMNEDPRFARVRIRMVLPALEAAGISATRISQAADHLARAREALDAETERFLERYARFASDGAAFLDGAALLAEPREIGLRALSAILMRVAGKAYRPRFERLERLYAVLLEASLSPTAHRAEFSDPPPPTWGGRTAVALKREAVRVGGVRYVAHTLSGCRIGPARRDLRHFGAATLEVRKENPRRSRFAHKVAAQKKVPDGTPIAQPGGKLPKKRRIIARLSGP